MLKHVPNILTVIRLLLIPFIVFFILTGHYILAFIFFTISGITDIADGFIARKFNLVSNFGKLMDPLADKLTQIATIASLVFTNIIPIWILLIVFLKEFIMICGASFLYGKDVVVYSKWYRKISNCFTLFCYCDFSFIKTIRINWYLGTIRSWYFCFGTSFYCFFFGYVCEGFVPKRIY